MKTHTMLKSYVFKSFKEIAEELYGKERSKDLYSKAVSEALKIAEDFGEISKAQETHCYGQIFPFIGVYRVMCDYDKRNADRILEKIMLSRSESAKKTLSTMLKFPMLYKAVPKICNSLVTKTFSEESGFVYGKSECNKSLWKADMLKCPYFEACKRYGCPEITHYFCDSDDIIYGSLHKNVKWKRTKTLGRGDNVCDFLVEIEK